MTSPVGVSTRPQETLLTNRARDVLAQGPVDSATLVRLVCAIPATPSHLADVMAAELLGGRPDFVRDGDGRWRLVSPEISPTDALQSERIPAAPIVSAAPMSFDEWRAARDRARETARLRNEVREPVPHDSYYAERVLERARARALAGCPAADAPLRSLEFAVVDVETTGGSPAAGHRITEIAVVSVRGGQVAEVFETLVNPERTIPPMIMKLTGITHEMVRDKPRFADVCDPVLQALRGTVFVAHNAGFDWRFVSYEIARATGQRLAGPRLCTVRFARRVLPHLQRRSLGHVADWYGADDFARTYFEGRHGTARPWRHSAAGDAVATAHCLVRMIGDAERQGCRTWGQLEEWLGSPSPRRPRRPRGRSGLPTPVDRDTTA